ncbi:hypothetical protein WUBG_05193 [Wuchereria bancrofti]|uniref:Uncharacterized protein n=1 Tax=Wuchereria bancrofti TaxID=6293 RepID=J9ENX7_WUCBA|nr:hypothetical protein WUBG_05193 [Wuchereria bancrofti]VDM07687.1 unnamed protein product [Wuchereria bancrofti]
MKKHRSSRPYLKCRLKFDWHIKSHDTSNRFLNSLAEFLLEKGFKRPGKIKRSWGQSVRESGTCNPQRTKDMGISKGDSAVGKTNSETTRKSSFALIGMRSVLRSMQRDVLSAVFFDTVTIKPSAVTTTLGLYATSLQNTKVYAISGLNAALSRVLNMPMVGAVGLINIPATKELCDLAVHSFTSVSISNKEKSLSTAITTELQTPTGKKKK